MTLRWRRLTKLLSSAWPWLLLGGPARIDSWQPAADTPTLLATCCQNIVLKDSCCKNTCNIFNNPSITSLGEKLSRSPWPNLPKQISMLNDSQDEAHSPADTLLLARQVYPPSATQWWEEDKGARLPLGRTHGEATPCARGQVKVAVVPVDVSCW